jgi:large subunit ribosomal protein L21
MQYAVIATGGKQYMVNLGQSIIIESLPQAVGENVTFDQVLLVVDGETTQIGQPVVADVLVTATVTEQRRGEKIKVFKYMPKSRYSRTMGHRQLETVVQIESIGALKVAKVVAPKTEVKAAVVEPKTVKAAKPRAIAKKEVAEVKE